MILQCSARISWIHWTSGKPKVGFPGFDCALDFTVWWNYLVLEMLVVLEDWVSEIPRSFNFNLVNTSFLLQQL